jgi:hypothetical protein
MLKPSGVAPLDLTYRDVASSGSNASSYDFGTLSFGDAYAGRYILAMAASDTQNITGVSIGGSAGAEMVYNDSAATAEFALYYRLIEAGTSGNVTVSLAGTAARCGVFVCSARLTSLTPFDTAEDAGSDPLTATIDVDEGGGLIGIYGTHSSGGSVTWSGITEEFESLWESPRLISGATETGLSAETGRAITCDPAANSDVAMFVVSLR